MWRRTFLRGSSAFISRDPAVRVASTILRLLLGPPSQRSFAVRYWDGSVELPGSSAVVRFTLVLCRAGSLRRMFLPPSELAVGEAYLRGDFDVDGDLEQATALLQVITTRLRSPLTVARILALLLRLPADDAVAAVRDGRNSPRRLRLGRHSQRRDAAAVRFHYDLGNDFYRLWLDRRMVYSCAYFETGNEDIDTAQKAKLDYICRKLRLRPGERLLDIGCGWGGLILHAAKQYGVYALGITLSEPQAHVARERIAAAGVADRCRVEVRDYRDLSHESGFDKLVSVGMFEHVGRARLPGYFDKAFRLLRPGGLFLNHGIVTLADDGILTRLLWRSGAFTQRYVFPDGELVWAGEAIRFAERAGFEPRDVESLREHYALTLRHWVRRLEVHGDEAVKLAGVEAYRIWRLYMSASARAFASGRLGIVQLLLSRPKRDGSSMLPLTRDELYRPPTPGSAVSSGSGISLGGFPASL